MREATEGGFGSKGPVLRSAALLAFVTPPAIFFFFFIFSRAKVRKHRTRAIDDVADHEMHTKIRVLGTRRGAWRLWEAKKRQMKFRKVQAVGVADA